MSDPIEITVRKGTDYMSPRRRSLYCQFQAPELLTSVAEELLSDIPSGPNGINHVVALGQYVKYSITYDRTGIFPQGTDNLLENTTAGDCVDQSVLLASLLEAAGYETRYCCYHRHGRTVGHCVIETLPTDTERAREDITASLRSKSRVFDRTPISWDVDRETAWLLIDPTSPLPVGVDRGELYRVTEAGVQWNENIDLVCFRPVQ
ncbi:transglutaminase domain-containing protein [Halobaculum sp. EA56]|uniref:transglutaminase domain-containing protein n=1 Tax=Halobaculum sp. EA56 TaxID=3421648 RepID=UPI003EB8C836